MKITAICASYNRPELLGRMIECFNRQTHQERELLILDDAGLYDHRTGDRWELSSVPNRFETYISKMNTLVAMVPAEIPGLAIWDDDDVYLPHALAACSEALERGAWAQPRAVYEHRPGGLFRLNTEMQGGNGYLYHGAWCFRREAFDAVGGYQTPSLSFDWHLGQAMQKKHGESVDTASAQHPDPYYIFCRNTITGKSDWPLGEVGYMRRNDEPPVAFDGRLDIRWQLDYTVLPQIGEDTGPHP